MLKKERRGFKAAALLGRRRKRRLVGLFLVVFLRTLETDWSPPHSSGVDVKGKKR
jgi:hypothetical protein